MITYTNKAPFSALRLRNLKTEFFTPNTSCVLRQHHSGGILKSRKQSLAILDLCLRKSRSGKSRDYGDVIRLSRKAPFSKCFQSTRKGKASVFKFLCFRKASFSWRFSVDGRPNRANKTALSNFSGVSGDVNAGYASNYC